MKKMICSLLAILMLPSCGTVEETASNTENIETAETVIETTLVDGISEVDYEDYDFHYITDHWTGTVTDRFLREMWAEELNGEPINDAVWKRNAFIADRLHVRVTAEDSQSTYTTVLNSVQAGEDAYQLVGGVKHECAMPLLKQGVLRDWNTLSTLDLTGEWWNQEAIQKLSIQGRQFMMSGSILMSEIDDTLAMVFNKSLQTEYNLDDIYDLVADGTWTLDKMMNMVEQVSVDLDGDGTMTFGTDLLGYAQDPNSMTVNWCFALDLLHGQMVDDNTYDWCLDLDRISTVLEQLSTMLKGSNTNTNTSYYDGLDVFAEGKIYIYAIILSALEIIREMEDDFGIIPYPKFDEEQTQYYNHVGSASPILTIPLTNVSDDTRTAAILHALAVSSHEYVRPVYFENVLKGKLSRDPQTHEMLDIIWKSATYDLGYLSGNTPIGTIQSLIVNRKTEFASSWKNVEKSYTTNMLKFLQDAIAE